MILIGALRFANTRYEVGYLFQILECGRQFCNAIAALLGYVHALTIGIGLSSMTVQSY